MYDVKTDGAGSEAAASVQQANRILADCRYWTVVYMIGARPPDVYGWIPLLKGVGQQQFTDPLRPVDVFTLCDSTAECRGSRWRCTTGVGRGGRSVRGKRRVHTVRTWCVQGPRREIPTGSTAERHAECSQFLRPITSDPDCIVILAAKQWIRRLSGGSVPSARTEPSMASSRGQK